MTKFRSTLFSSLLILCLASSQLLSAFAQGQTTGAIQGRAYEAGAGTPVPAVIVTVINQDTGLERTTVTGGDGTYFMSTLPPGFYTLTAAHQGYESDPITNFPIRLSKTNLVQPPPFVLRRKAGPLTPPAVPGPQVTPPPQTTTPPSLPVSQSGPPAIESELEQLVNTINATRGGNFDRRQLLLLPLPGVRTFDNLAFLAPGVAPPPQAIGKTLGPGIGPGVGTSGQFSVNGLRSRANNFTIDGSDNNDEDIGVRRQGFTSLVPQPIESVQEFQIATLLPTPEFGRNLSAQVNAVSRSGGIEYHGTIYGFLTDSRLKARDAFDRSGGPNTFPIFSNGRAVRLNAGLLEPLNPVGGEDPFTRAMYGFVFGGPIIKQKTHFFVSFERQDINASRESHFAVPTVEQRGLFGRGTTGLLTSDGQNVFPASLAGDAFFSLFPFPNNPFGPYGRSTYTEVLPASADGTIFSIKLDQNIKAFGKEHNFSARYNFTDDDTTLPVTGEALFSTLRALVRTQNLSLLFNSPLTANLTNQARFSYGRTRLEFKEVRNPFLLPSTLFPNQPFLLNAPLVLSSSIATAAPLFVAPSGFDAEIGAGSAPEIGVFTGTGPIGQVKVSGFSPVGVDVFNFPQGRSNNTFQYADTLIYNRGNHRFTTGFDIRRTQLNSFLDRNFRPLAVFSGAANLSGFKLVDQRETNPFLFGSDFVAAGAATGFFQAQAIVPDSTIGLRYWQNDFFFSDQIRVRSNFTLTLGIRYELNTVPREVNNRIESTFNSSDVKEFIEIERGLFGKSGLEQFLAGREKIFEQDNNNIAPHIAFAWDPFGDGKTSIRAGYGIYYDQILGAVISQSRNVFPSFLTVNLAGFGAAVPGQIRRLSAANPAFVAAPGTLNTFRANLASPANFLAALSVGNSFSSGAAFVLPANDLQTPYAQHWGLTIERQMKSDFLLSAAYVGTRGSHLLRFATPNLGPNAIPIVASILAETPQSNFPNFRFPAFFGSTIPPLRNAPALDGRPFPLLGSFTSIESDANSTYHALQAQLIKRFSRGIQFTTAYTWSRAIDQVSDLFDLAGAPALPQNSFDLSAERADANFDVRHRFVYSLIWDIPAFEGNNWLGGWQLASIGTFQTGQPYSVLFCCDANLDGNLTDRVTPDATIAGQAPRNLFRAPGISTVDVALNKVFKFTERHNLEFRAEAFNVFNRANFGIPVHQLFFGEFTVEPLTQKIFVDTRVPARTIQFAVKYNF